jgi:hypothetical protein
LSFDSGVWTAIVGSSLFATSVFGWLTIGSMASISCAVEAGFSHGGWVLGGWELFLGLRLSRSRASFKSSSNLIDSAARCY